MKLQVILLILPALGFIGCKQHPAAVAPPCPAGTQAMGAVPPKGEETWCQKTMNGEAVKEGPFAMYRGDGSMMLFGNYHDGKQDGEWTMWYENGQKASIDHYKDGQQEGEHIGWYTNGKISAKGQYKDGKREGVWKRWDPEGFRNWEEIYKDDNRVS